MKSLESTFTFFETYLDFSDLIVKDALFGFINQSDDNLNILNILFLKTLSFFSKFYSKFLLKSKFSKFFTYFKLFIFNSNQRLLALYRFLLCLVVE